MMKIHNDMHVVEVVCINCVYVIPAQEQGADGSSDANI